MSLHFFYEHSNVNTFDMTKFLSLKEKLPTLILD